MTAIRNALILCVLLAASCSGFLMSPLKLGSHNVGKIKSLAPSLSRGIRCAVLMVDAAPDNVQDVEMDWRALAAKVFETDKRPVVLYDGVCNMCNTGVNFMLDYDKPDQEEGDFRFAALQSKVGKALLIRGGRKSDDISSIVLATADGKIYLKSEAVLRMGSGLASGSKTLKPFSPIPSALTKLPSFLRDGVYDFVAKNRYSVLGKRPDDQCRFDGGEKFEKRFVPDP